MSTEHNYRNAQAALMSSALSHYRSDRLQSMQSIMVHDTQYQKQNVIIAIDTDIADATHN